MAKEKPRPGRFRRGRRARLPAGLEDLPGGMPDAPDDPGPPGHRGRPPEGGAGVREPRRPKPAPPAMGAELDEPVDHFVDATSSRESTSETAAV